MPALYAGFFLCVCVRICVLVSAFDAALRFTIQGNGASCNPCLCAFHLSFPFFIDFSLACLFCFFFLILVRVHNCTIMIPSLFSFLFCSFLVTLKFFLLFSIVVCSASYNRNTTVSCPHTREKTAATTPAQQQQRKECLPRPFTPAVREVLCFYPLSLSLALCRSTIWLSVVELLSALRWQSKKKEKKEKKTKELREFCGALLILLFQCW